MQQLFRRRRVALSQAAEILRADGDVQPKEGLVGYETWLAPVRGAPHPNVASAWINYLLSTEVQSEIPRLIGYNAYGNAAQGFGQPSPFGSFGMQTTQQPQMQFPNNYGGYQPPQPQPVTPPSTQPQSFRYGTDTASASAAARS